nr:LYR motif-containing protein 2-like [Peromyscus maniculatus bairdii]
MATKAASSQWILASFFKNLKKKIHDHGKLGSRLPPTALTLKQFMRRQQVLLLYRKILRAIRQVPSEADRKYLQDWAREEFKQNKSATEEDTIRMMITQGNMQLKELERTLALAKS